jgi:hypothetical protein
MIAAHTTAPEPVEAMLQTLQAARHEGNGVWRLSLLTAEAYAALLADAISGDAEAARLVHLLHHLRQQLDTGRTSSGSTPQCLLCGTEFEHDNALRVAGVLNAAVDVPVSGITVGVCSRCHETAAAETVLFDAVVRALGVRFGLGELRRLPPFVATAGHA